MKAQDLWRDPFGQSLALPPHTAHAKEKGHKACKERQADIIILFHKAHLLFRIFAICNYEQLCYNLNRMRIANIRMNVFCC